MATPLRHSLPPEDVKTESPENPTSVLQARRALVEFQSNPEEMSEPSRQRQDQDHPVYRRGQAWGPLESSWNRTQVPPRVSEIQAWSHPKASISRVLNSTFSQSQVRSHRSSPRAKAKWIRNCPRVRRSRPRGPRISVAGGLRITRALPWSASLGPEPSKPLQELTPQSPGSPRDQHE